MTPLPATLVNRIVNSDLYPLSADFDRLVRAWVDAAAACRFAPASSCGDPTHVIQACDYYDRSCAAAAGYIDSPAHVYVRRVRALSMSRGGRSAGPLCGFPWD